MSPWKLDFPQTAMNEGKRAKIALFARQCLSANIDMNYHRHVSCHWVMTYRVLYKS